MLSPFVFQSVVTDCQFVACGLKVRSLRTKTYQEVPNEYQRDDTYKIMQFFVAICFSFNYFLYFCNCIRSWWLWSTLSCAELLSGALHIRRRYWRFVFGSIETSTNRISNPRQMQGWLPRSVVYTLRSVLRGSGILNAHFTGVYIPQRGCFSVCFSAKAVEGQER